MPRKSFGVKRKRCRLTSMVHARTLGLEREMFSATCSQCGGVAEVPFQPRGDKPVYCRDCFATRQTSYR